MGFIAALEHGGQETPQHPPRHEDNKCNAHDDHTNFHTERRDNHREHRNAHRHNGGPSNHHPEISTPNFFQLLHVPVALRKQNRAEPLVDYTKSIIMIGNDYIRAMEEKASRKEVVEKGSNHINRK
jgi:hypothetical protein